MKRKQLVMQLAAVLLLASCATPIVPESSFQSLSSESTTTSYEGESTMYIYEVWMEKDVNHPTQAKFDMSFVVKNGDPIIGTRERQYEIEVKLNPTSPTYGDGYFFVYGFYYDFDCTQEVGLSDIAVKDLSLFYYRRG